MYNQDNAPGESSELPPPPPGWELDEDGESVNDFEREEVRQLRILPIPLWLLRLFRPFRRRKNSARNDWLAYYEGLYTSRIPDVSLFSRLLAKNGFWDIPSPFISGSRQSSDFCPSGVLLADVAFLLERWSLHVMERGFGFFDPGSTEVYGIRDSENDYIGKNTERPVGPALDVIDRSTDYSPIHLHMALQARADSLEQVELARRAAVCLAILFQDDEDQWTWLSEHLHIENRVLLCKIVHDAASPEIQQLLRKAWVLAGWLSQGSADRLWNSSEKFEVNCVS